MNAKAHYTMVDGYCYELSGRTWRSATDNDWETDMHAPSGRERLLGFREIDGAPCAVFRCAGARVRAQTLAAVWAA
jgi:hypothetical protein